MKICIQLDQLLESMNRIITMIKKFIQAFKFMINKSKLLQTIQVCIEYCIYYIKFVMKLNIFIHMQIINNNYRYLHLFGKLNIF